MEEKKYILLGNAEAVKLEDRATVATKRGSIVGGPGDYLVRIGSTSFFMGAAEFERLFLISEEVDGLGKDIPEQPKSDAPAPSPADVDQGTPVPAAESEKEEAAAEQTEPEKTAEAPKEPAPAPETAQEGNGQAPTQDPGDAKSETSGTANPPAGN